MSLDYAGDQLFLPNIVRAIGQAMVLTPLTVGRRRGSIAPQDAAAASGHQFNMLRNLGGAIGTAVLATIDHQARAVPLQHHRPVGRRSAARKCASGSPS